MAEQYVSGNVLARHLGISEAMVRKYKKSGLLVPIARGQHVGKYSLRDSKLAYERNRDPDAVLRGTGDGGGSRMPENSLTRARTIHAEMKIERERIELAKQRGELIAKADVIAACRHVVTTVCERIDGAAAQIAPRVAGMTSAAEIEAVVRDALNSVRREIASLGENERGAAT